MTEPLLRVAGLRAGYGKVQALHGIDFEIFPGEVVAILGANGAGKSTTFRAISGLMKPFAGEIRFRGEQVGGRPADAILRAGIAHCPEERHVWREMTVEENLRLGAYACRGAREVERRLAPVMDRFPRLRERRRQWAGTLSGGEQQMLAIGRALVSAPRLLLLDEPSLGLSPLMVAEVMQCVRALRDAGVAVLLVEQNVHHALDVVSRAYVFETGRIVAADAAVALRGNADLLRAYLGG